MLSVVSETVNLSQKDCECTALPIGSSTRSWPATETRLRGVMLVWIAGPQNIFGSTATEIRFPGVMRVWIAVAQILKKLHANSR